MKMTMTSVTLWVMPLGAEVLGADGRQSFYATENGSGSVIDLPVVGPIEFTCEDDL